MSKSKDNEKDGLKIEIVETENSNNDIKIIMEKAICDEDFKEALLSDPDEVLEDYELSEVTKLMVKSLSREDYDKLTPENITEYFSADSAIYTPDFDDSIEIEYVDEDEI